MKGRNLLWFIPLLLFALYNLIAYEVKVLNPNNHYNPTEEVINGMYTEDFKCKRYLGLFYSCNKTACQFAAPTDRDGNPILTVGYERSFTGSFRKLLHNGFSIIFYVIIFVIIIIFWNSESKILQFLDKKLTFNENGLSNWLDKQAYLKMGARLYYSDKRKNRVSRYVHITNSEYIRRTPKN